MVTRMAGVFVMKLAERDTLSFSSTNTETMINDYVSAIDQPMIVRNKRQRLFYDSLGPNGTRSIRCSEISC